MPGFQTFSGLLHDFVLTKLATSNIRVQHSSYQLLTIYIRELMYHDSPKLICEVLHHLSLRIDPLYLVVVRELTLH